MLGKLYHKQPKAIQRITNLGGSKGILKKEVEDVRFVERGRNGKGRGEVQGM